MKQFMYFVLLVGICALLALGFQCSSAELTSAKLYYQRQDWDNAEKSAEKEVQRNPKSVEGWFLLGDIRAQKKNYEGMVEAWDQCLKISKEYEKDIKERKYYYWAQVFNSGVNAFNKARTADSPSEYDKAINDFRMATLIEPDSVAAYKNMVFAYLSKKDPGGAVEPLSKWRIKATMDPEPYYYLGRVYYENGQSHRDKFDSDNKETIETISKLEKISPGYYKEDVRALLGQPDKVNAETPKKPSKKGTKPQQPEKEEWVYNKFNLHLNFEGNTLKTKKFDPPYTPKIDSTEFYKAVEEFDKAIKELTEANRLDPNSEDIMAYLSNAYIGANKTAEAMEVFRKSVETNPKNKAFRYNYGVLLLKAAEADTNCVNVDKNYGDALLQFEEAVKLDSAYENALYNLAVGYVNWGVKQRECSQKAGKEGDESFKTKFKQAQPHLERLLALKSNDPFMWETLGRVYMNLNMKDKAEEAFKKADEIRNRK